jgi:hypothetical protein
LFDPLDAIVVLTNRADRVLLISWVSRRAANQTGPNNFKYSHSVCEIWTWHFTNCMLRSGRMICWMDLRKQRSVSPPLFYFIRMKWSHYETFW